MHIARLFLYAFFLSGLMLVLLACDDDPSGVGVGVGPDPLEGGEPITVDLLPNTVDTERAPAVAGGVGTQSPQRFFAGRVDDPVAGVTRAEGFFNVRQPASVSSSFVEGPVDGAFLRFAPVSVYGDTTGTLSLTVYDMPAPWSPDEARTDTTLASGDAVTSVDFLPTDEEVLIPLPESWIQENEATLRDTTDGGQSFLDTFAGFRIAHESGNAAVGFNRTDANLSVVTGSDTTALEGRASLTTVERDTAPNLPDDRILVQSGFGQTLTFAFDFENPPLDTLQGVPVNRAEFVLPVDSTLFFENTPEGFVRPQPSDYELSGISTDDAQEVTLASGISVVTDAVRITGENPLQVFEDSFLRTPPFQRFIVTPRGGTDGSSDELSLGVSVFHRVAPDADEDPSTSPRATVTVTPF